MKKILTKTLNRILEQKKMKMIKKVIVLGEIKKWNCKKIKITLQKIHEYYNIFSFLNSAF